jgi:hypothetical protein
MILSSCCTGSSFLYGEVKAGVRTIGFICNVVLAYTETRWDRLVDLRCLMYEGCGRWVRDAVTGRVRSPSLLQQR